MRVACIQISVWFAREKGKGKKKILMLQYRFSPFYFLPIWEERKILALWRTLHFPFPRSISLQTNKGFFFSFLPLPSLAFPLASLQPNTHTHTYILNIFSSQCSLIIVQNMELFGNLQNLLFIYFFFREVEMEYMIKKMRVAYVVQGFCFF